MEEEKIRGAVVDAMSDFFNDVISKRFDLIDKQFEIVQHELRDLRLTNEVLVNC